MALIAMLAVLVEHWLPWRAMLGRDLPRTAAYVLGTLAILLPMTALLMSWSDWQAALALWVVAGAAGLGTLGGHVVDHMLEMRARSKVAEKHLEILTQGVRDAQDR
jgi:hypothetical protein